MVKPVLEAPKAFVTGGITPAALKYVGRKLKNFLSILADLPTKACTTRQRVVKIDLRNSPFNAVF